MAVPLAVIGIAVPDMAAALQFYRRFGLRVPEGVGGEGHVEVELGGLHLARDAVELLESVYGRWDEPTGHRIELAFRCDARAEVDAIHAAMTGYGHRGQTAPWDAVWSERYAILADPDGNLISLYA
jgi:catechol 2,3-dioxygenase-like lactoylglutathione lyase family enzyme